MTTARARVSLLTARERVDEVRDLVTHDPQASVAVGKLALATADLLNVVEWLMGEGEGA